MYATDLTVGAVIERDEKFLIVEESAMGRRVLSQPGGHIEAGESPEQAVVRETLEETGCHVRCGDLIGVYLWIHPQTRQQFLRLMYAAGYVACDAARPLDDGIFARRWMKPRRTRGPQAAVAYAGGTARNRRLPCRPPRTAAPVE